jgi:Protein of unknown function (DUF2442)
MTPRIPSVAFARDYTVRLCFADGAEGKIDLFNELDGEIFLPLRDAAFFSQVRLHPELHTITWPNGADFAPEFLYHQINVPA